MTELSVLQEAVEAIEQAIDPVSGARNLVVQNGGRWDVAHAQGTEV